MRRLLFSLVSTKIPHSPSHWITAAVVLKDIPQCLCRLSYIGVYRRSDSPRYSERRARYFFALPSVSTKAAFFHAAQSSDRSPQRHPPPTRPEPAGRSDPTAHVHMHKRHLCRYCAFLAAKLKYHVRLTPHFDTI